MGIGAMRSGSPYAVLAACLMGIGTSGFAQEAGGEALTFDNLLNAGIVAFVDKEFVIVGAVTWATPTVKVPEDPRTPAEMAALAGPLKVRIGGKAGEGLSGRDALLLMSDKLTKVKGADGAEQWAFGGRRLVRDGDPYRLHVKLLLRASFKKELLMNPAFVRQANQPKYWAQTFEMELIGVEPAKGTDAAPEPAAVL